MFYKSIVVGIKILSIENKICSEIYNMPLDDIYVKVKNFFVYNLDVNMHKFIFFKLNKRVVCYSSRFKFDNLLINILNSYNKNVLKLGKSITKN